MFVNLHRAIVLFLLLCCSAYAETTDENCQEMQILLERNVYVKLEQILFENNKIFVSINDVIYQTPAIYTDENGYYIQKLFERECSWYEWKCPRCYQCNWKIDLVCPCGYQR